MHHHAKQPVALSYLQSNATECQRHGHKANYTPESIGVHGIAMKSTSSKNIKPKKEKSVSFGNLQIRTYETLLEDNPSCSSAPPLVLGEDTTQIILIFPQTCMNSSKQRFMEITSLVQKSSSWTEKTEKLSYYQVQATPVKILLKLLRGIVTIKNQRRQTVDTLHVAWLECRGLNSDIWPFGHGERMHKTFV